MNCVVLPVSHKYLSLWFTMLLGELKARKKNVSSFKSKSNDVNKIILEYWIEKCIESAKFVIENTEWSVPCHKTSLSAQTSLMGPYGQDIGTAGLSWKLRARGSSSVSLPASWEGFVTEMLITDQGDFVETNRSANVFCRRESRHWKNLHLVQWKGEILLFYGSSPGSHEW